MIRVYIQAADAIRDAFRCAVVIVHHCGGQWQRVRSRGWSWMLASGIIDLILAAIIFAGLPGTAAWAIWLLGQNCTPINSA